MSQEEWGVIEADLGFQQGRYVREILPKLVRRSFWSSSVVGSDDRKGGYFHGSDGNVHIDTAIRVFKMSVRCGARAG